MSCDLKRPVGEVGGVEEGMVLVGTDVVRWIGRCMGFSGGGKGEEGSGLDEGIGSIDVN